MVHTLPTTPLVIRIPLLYQGLGAGHPLITTKRQAGTGEKVLYGVLVGLRPPAVTILACWQTPTPFHLGPFH